MLTVSRDDRSGQSATDVLQVVGRVLATAEGGPTQKRLRRFRRNRRTPFLPLLALVFWASATKAREPGGVVGMVWCEAKKLPDRTIPVGQFLDFEHGQLVAVLQRAPKGFSLGIAGEHPVAGGDRAAVVVGAADEDDEEHCVAPFRLFVCCAPGYQPISWPDKRA